MIQLIELYHDDPAIYEIEPPPNEHGIESNDEEQSREHLGHDTLHEFGEINDDYEDDKDDHGVEIIAEEEYAIGKGQSIESEMAASVGTKMFQVYQPRNLSRDDAYLGDFDVRYIDKVVSHIKAWYDNLNEDNTDVSQQQQQEQIEQEQTLESQQSSYGRCRWCSSKKFATFGGANPDSEFFILGEDP